MIKVLKAKKARTNNGTCPLCRGPLLVGQRISLYVSMTRWVHSRCAVKLCTGCGQRLPLTQIAAGAEAHPMCRGEAE